MNVVLLKVLSFFYYRLYLHKISALDRFNEFLHYCKTQEITNVQENFGTTLSFFRPKNNGSNGIVLTQMVDNYSYAIKLAAAAKVLADKRNASVSFYDVHIYDSLGILDRNHSTYEKYFLTPNEKIHLNFGDSILFKNDERYKDQGLIKKELNKFRGVLKTGDDVLEVYFEDCHMGDLLYDTYIRFYDVPTLEEVNGDVFKIIEIGLNMYYNFCDLLKKNKVNCLLNSYSSYLQHGLSARVCMHKGIDVYCIGALSYVIQKLTKEFPFHAVDHTTFDPNKQLTVNEKQVVQKLLQDRFSGVIDASLSSLTVTAYNDIPLSDEMKEQFSARKRNVVIYAHEFVDTPHENRKLQFNDLYQHLKQSLIALQHEKDLTVFIKIHPSGYEKSKRLTRELVKSFSKPHFVVLDDHFSNKHIIALKPDIIATIWGSVGLEMAYHEIPVATLYDCLYMNFDFVHTCYSLDEYFGVLKGNIPTEITFDRNQMYAFYHQVYLERSIPDQDHVFNRLIALEAPENTDDYLVKLLQSDIPSKYGELLEGLRNKIEIEDNIEKVAISPARAQ